MGRNWVAKNMSKRPKEEKYSNVLVKQISKIDPRAWTKDMAIKGIKIQEEELAQIFPIVKYLITAFEYKIEELEKKIDDLEGRLKINERTK